MSFGTILYTVILYPLVQLIEISFFLFNKLFDNTGISVLGVSFVVTLLCLPLYIIAEHWQQVERDTQAKLKPGIDRIKSVFTGDEQYMILSTYYKQNHYHPIMALRSSFGLLIQIPFFMAAYSCLSKLPALQGASFLFIRDMGVPDALFYIGSFPVNILPIAMTLINIIAGAIYTKGFPFKEKAQIYGMALLFLVILYNSPAGLVLYWTMNNVFSLIKNIFYKLKNPLKVLYYTMCAFIVFIAVYVLFIYDGGASPKKRLAAAIPTLMLIPIPLYLKAINWLIDKPLKTIRDNSKTRHTIFIFAALALAILNGLVVPGSLISSSPQEFSNIGSYGCPTNFLRSPFWQSIGLFVIWPLCIYFLFKERLQTVIASLFCSLLFGACLNVFAFAGNYGSMDITLKFIGGITSQSMTFQILNALVWLLICCIPFVIIGFKKEKIVSSLCIVTTLVFTLLSIVSVTQIKNAYKEFMSSHDTGDVSDGFSPKFHLSKTEQNVFIIMLDRAESSYFEHILSDFPEMNDMYSGFTYYPNTVSYNGHTLMASPALYGGYEYTPDEINKKDYLTLKEKHNQATLLMPRIFTEQAGFTADMYDTSWGNFSYIADMNFTTPYDAINGDILNGRYTGELKTSLDSYDSTNLVNSVNRNLFFVSLFREVPALLRPVVYYKGSWWSSEEATDMDSFLDWYGELFYMDKITDFTNEKPSLTVLTNEATHLNENIRGLGILDLPPDDDDCGYSIDAACLLKIGEWFEFLKENDVYDNTRIIIVADHGIGYGDYYDKMYVDPVIDGNIKDHLNPLLLVKDFNATGSLKTDMSFMTNADVPTIALSGIVENPINPFTENIISSEAKENGVYVTFDDIFMPHHTKSNNVFTIDDDTWYTVKDDIFSKDGWVRGKQ